MKVAIVHDWFVGGGAERVVYELHKMYPGAPIYTSYCSDEWRKKLSGTKVITSYMQNWPFSKMRKFLPPLRAHWFSRLDLSDYDLVLSSSGAEAKGIKTKKPTIHVNYCHAPTHYYWNRYDEYKAHPGFGFLDPLARLGLKLLVGPMRKWDYKAAQRPDYIIANSNFTKDQIKKYYDRDSVVIHPPVDVERFRPKKETERHGFLIAGRQTPYKRFDLAVQVCTDLQLPLTVLGDGPDHQRLLKLAGPSVEFTGHVSDDERIKYFQTAEAFIFPGVDDFGIAPVEALAAGTPVIAYEGGGALDYIEPGITGEFFTEQTVGSLSKIIKKFSPNKFNGIVIKKSADKFSANVFKKEIEEFISVIQV